MPEDKIIYHDVKRLNWLTTENGYCFVESFSWLQDLIVELVQALQRQLYQYKQVTRSV